LAPRFLIQINGAAPPAGDIELQEKCHEDSHDGHHGLGDALERCSDM